jgi:hypothetical protein
MPVVVIMMMLPFTRCAQALFSHTVCGLGTGLLAEASYRYLEFFLVLSYLNICIWSVNVVRVQALGWLTF